MHKAYRNTRIRISPKNITKQAGVRNVTRTLDVGNLFHLAQFRRQAPVHTNNLVINDSAARKAVEGVAKLLPHLNGKSTTAFIVKSINSVDSGTFVVSSKKKEIFRVLNLVGKEETDDFQRLLATVHVISQEQVVCLTSITRGE
jgi:hypothetical protein